jgi:NAD-dependent deacetylase
MSSRKKLVVLTGAGVSAESGISTFRDSNGLWENHKVEEVAAIEGWYADPALVLRFYNERRAQLAQVRPNAAHVAIASLEKDWDVIVVTQNVDNLHERAGSTRVIHLHGELTKVTSSLQPNNPRYIRELPPEEYEVHLGDCAADGSQLRPYIVWFGEEVPNIEVAADHVMQADVLIIIGTSLNVYPAAGLVQFTKSGAQIYLIDPAEVKVPYGLPVHVIKKGASEGMRELVESLNDVSSI